MKKVLLFLITFLMVINVKAEDNIKYLNLDKSESIIIDISNNLISIQNTKDLTSNEITIKDFDIYKSTFQEGDINKYPLYIIDNNSEYSFSDYQKDGNNVYILSNKILNVVTEDISTDISSCESLFGYQLINLLKNNIFKLVYYLIPIILIITSTFDFAKLVFSSDKEGIPGALKRFLKRVIASILVFLVPNILIFLINLFGSDEIKTCITTFQNTTNITQTD